MPPNTGHRSIDAISIPGTLTSIPNTALPSTFTGVSSRGVRVPSRRKSFGSLSGTSVGTGSLAARAASLPYVSRRLVGVWITAPCSARHGAIHVPRRRRRADQQLARSGARLAQRIPRGADRRAAAGGHAARPAGGILGHRPEPHLRPVCLQLLGEDHRETGLRPLAHLGLVHGQRDD